jgi:hypothetical protein
MKWSLFLGWREYNYFPMFAGEVVITVLILQQKSILMDSWDVYLTLLFPLLNHASTFSSIFSTTSFP